MLHRGMYPVPATPRAYHPSFTRDIVQVILVVPQGRALVNRKPYPVCLFFWRGRPSTDAPGVQILILQRRLSVSSHKNWHPAPSAQPQAGMGRGFSSLAFQGERPVAYPRNTSGVQSPDSKRRIVLLLAEPTRKKPRRQELSGPGPKSCAWPAADTRLPTPHRTEHGVRWQYQELLR